MWLWVKRRLAGAEKKPKLSCTLLCDDDLTSVVSMDSQLPHSNYRCFVCGVLGRINFSLQYKVDFHGKKFL